MATRIKPKRSETSSSVPTTSNLAVGEIAINSADQKIYTRDSNDNIVTLAQPGLLNVVEDTTPQLGGDLDLNSSDITGTGNIDITGSVTACGSFVRVRCDNSSIVVDDSGNSRLGLIKKGGSFPALIAGSASPLILGHSTNCANIVDPTNATLRTDLCIATGGDVTITCNLTVGGTLNTHTIPSGTGTLALTSDLGLSNVVEDTTPQLGGNLDLNSSNITGTGNINITGGVTLANNCRLTLGDAGEYIYGDGTNLQMVSSNALGIDVANGIVLDSGSGGTTLKAGGGTIYGTLTSSSGDFSINQTTSDKDIIFTGNDGGSTITALTLDMSESGNASFNNNVTVGNNLVVTGDLTVSGTTTTVNTETINLADNVIVLNSNATGSATENAGIEVERGDDANKTLIWNETTDKWTVGAETFNACTLEVDDGSTTWPISSKSDNLHIGTDASCSLTTGANNIAVGCLSLKLNEDGSNNIAIGQNSLCCATTPSTNIVIGKNSLCASDECTFVARWNGSSYPTVTCSTTKNIVIGNDLLSNEIMSSYNTVIGNDIATCASSCVFSWGCTCTCNGQSAIPYDEYNSYNNTLIGNCIAPFAGRLDKSVVLGSNIAFSTSNTCPIVCSQIFGYNILNCAQTDCGGNGEVIRSFLAGSDMFKDTPMYEINRTIAIGNEIGVTGTYNCRRTEFIRQQCSVLLGDYVSQFGNSFSAVSIGACSTKTLYTNNNSVFIGASAGDGDGTSNNTRCTLNLQNVAIGSFAMGQIGYNNTTTPSLTIRDNTTVGYASLYSVSGNYNTALGSLSGYCITTGDCNTTIGTNSGFGITTGSCNTFIGESSGCTLTTGNNNIIIGHNTQPSSNTVSNETSIGGSCFRFPGISSTSGQVLCYNGTHWVAGDASSSYGVDGSTSGTSIYISDTSCSFTTGTGNTIVGESTGCSITSSSYNTLIGYCTGHLISSQANASNIAIGSGISGAYGAPGGVQNISIGFSSMGGCSVSTGGDSKGCCNIAIGSYSGYCLNSGGCYNLFLGICAGQLSTCGDNNIALGNRALGCDSASNTADNIVIGQCAGLYIAGTTGNVAIGKASLQGTTPISGACNTTLGFCTGYSITTGCQNTLIGACAGRTITTGNTNIVIGFNASPSSATVSNETTINGSCFRFPGLNTTTGNILCYNGTHWVSCANPGCDWSPGNIGQIYKNVYVSDTACSLTTGNCNTIVGTCAGCSLTTGCLNTLVGICAGRLLTDSSARQNIAIGQAALGQVQYGRGNVAIGYLSLGGATTSGVCSKGEYNIGIGSNTGFCLTGGACCNIMIGEYAGNNITSGNQNIAIGIYTLSCTTTGSNQTAVGSCALRYVSGGNNTAFGASTLQGDSSNAGSNTAGGNVAVGVNVMANITTGQCNTAIGSGPTASISSGNCNVIIGAQSGRDGVCKITGDCNIIVGSLAGNSLANDNSGSNNIIIGHGADFSGTLDGTCSNTIILGNSSHTTLIMPGLSASNGQTLCFNGTGFVAADSAGVTPWQAVCTANFTAVAGLCYFVNTTSAAITATLPASASLGDEIHFKDYADTFDTNNLTVGRNSHNIEGSAADLTVATEGAGFTLVYVDSTKGWLLKDV